MPRDKVEGWKEDTGKVEEEEEEVAGGWLWYDGVAMAGGARPHAVEIVCSFSSS